MMRYLLACFLFFSCNDEKKYCGVIASKGYEAPTSGYKSSRYANYYLLMRVDSINKIIRIDVNVPTWHALHPGDRACFILDKFDMIDYGNGDKHLIK